eukprot:741460_1
MDDDEMSDPVGTPASGASSANGQQPTATVQKPASPQPTTAVEQPVANGQPSATEKAQGEPKGSPAKRTGTHVEASGLGQHSAANVQPGPLNGAITTTFDHHSTDVGLGEEEASDERNPSATPRVSATEMSSLTDQTSTVQGPPAVQTSDADREETIGGDSGPAAQENINPDDAPLTA